MNTYDGVGVFLHFLATNPLIIAILILGLVVLYILVRLWRSFMGPLKYGKVISADHTPDGWKKLDRPLFSKKMLLAGMPDYIIQGKHGEVVPVEVKSTSYHGRVYDSHKYQLLAYCLLLENEYGTAPPYGVIQYGDGHQVKIPYTPQLKQELIRTMDEMRSLTLPRGWQPDSRRCRSCSMRGKCDRVAG